MKITSTTLLTVALTSAATIAFARGFGDRSNDSSQDVRGGSRGSYVSGSQSAPRATPTPNQSLSGARPSAGIARTDAARVNAAPAPSLTPRVSPSPVTTRSSGAFSGGDSARTAPAPQVARTYAAPRFGAENSGSAPRIRNEDTTRTAIVRENPAQTAAGSVTAQPRTSGFAGTVRRDDTPRTTVQTATPLTADTDNARNSGTARGFFPTRRESVTPAAPAVTSRPAADSQRAPVSAPIERTQPRLTERTSQPVIGTSQPRSADTAATGLPPVNPARSVSRSTMNQTGLTRAGTRDGITSPSGDQHIRDASVASHDLPTRSNFQRITAPDTRLVSPATARGSSSMLRFGSAYDNMKPRNSSLSPDGLSARSSRRGGEDTRGGNAAVAGQLPSRISGARDFSASERRPPASGRYEDGRSSVYHAPDRSAYMNRQGWFPPQPAHYNTRHEGHNSHDYDHHDHYDCHYSHHAFSPVWCGPVVYPAGSYFGFSWSNGSYGLSFASYSPSYVYNTRYYDSWSCGGWGYSGVYYGGWCNNWYGGFSYVYNPWPVYRTYYLYEPAPVVVYESAPVVTRTETVYVTEPATTSYVVQNAAAAPAPQQLAAPVAETQQAVWEAAPAVARAEMTATSCFCPCHCNGQRPCTCDYPCGAEYAVTADQFNLSVGYRSYAETLNAETIWTSYAGLDRWDAYTEPQAYDATALTDTARRQ